MKAFCIYVEGKSDLLFITQFLKSHLGFEFEVNLKKWKATYIVPDKMHISLQTMTPKDGEGGIDAKKINDLIHQIKTVNVPKGVESIILLDADTLEHKNPQGGFESRKKYLSKLNEGVDFKYFVIPDHSSDGNLESILDKIVCTKGADFYSCLNQYVTGLLNLKDESRPRYVIENPKLEKEKISWYVYMMEGKSGTSKNALDNAELWDFNSDALNPMKTFFSNIFM